MLQGTQPATCETSARGEGTSFLNDTWPKRLSPEEPNLEPASAREVCGIWLIHAIRESLLPFQIASEKSMPYFQCSGELILGGGGIIRLSVFLFNQM